MIIANHVWGYWDCPYCDTNHIRADNNHCPHCGIPVPPDTKFYIDKNNIEYVAENQKKTEANWICNYCDAQNSYDASFCENCGSPKDDATKNYFGHIKEPSQVEPTKSPPNEEEVKRIRKQAKRDYNTRYLKFFSKLLLFYLVFGLVISSFFIPITRHTTIDGFTWSRSIAIEVFNNYNESDWYLPSGANLHSTSQEIHHYEQILDHYETKTRTYTEEVFDGYDTDYRDLGNGQFEEIQTPKYRTEYRTETYEEPVYRDEPVYQTKYYYDIDRWKEQYSIDTKGNDKNPEWGDLPSNIITDSYRLSNPEYGDKKEGEHEEHYYVNTTDESGNSQTIEYLYNEWLDLNEGDGIEYKSYWWSKKPINKRY